jgi:hypothetical protein
MNDRSLFVFVVGIIVGFSFAVADTIKIHVSTKAIPDETSTESIAVARTIPEALEILREIRADGTATPAQIILHDEKYEIRSPVIVDPPLAGNGLTFLPFDDNSHPVISGGRVIDNVHEHTDGTWRVTIDEVRNGNWWFEEVFAETDPRIRARHPNDGFARVVDAGPDNRTNFTFDPAELPLESLDANSEVVFFHDWSTSRIQIASIESETHTLRFANRIGCKAPHYAITHFERHPRFYIEGSPLLVDRPGEWALHRETGEFVYFPLPDEQIDNIRLIAPVAPSLFHVQGTIDTPVTNVVFRGVSFAHVNWPIPDYGYAEGQAAFFEQRDNPASDGTRDAIPAAIEFTNARDCRVVECEVSAVGGSGIWIGQECRDCEIVDSVVRNAGANGIMIGEAAGRSVEGGPWWQNAPEQVASGNTVEHTLVEKCGRRFFGSVGVWIGLAEQTSVSKCEIRDLPYTGVSVGWRWDPTPTPCKANVIKDNHIHHIMQTLSDGGGIYTLGLQPGTVLRRNAIHHVLRNAGRAPSNGMFLDQGTMDLVLEENIFWAIDTTPIRWHWTYTNIVRNNTFVLREGQRIAHYNRAQAEDITYLDNRAPNESDWSVETDEIAQSIMRNAGPRVN